MGATNPNAGGAPGGGGKGGMAKGPVPSGPQANYGMGINPNMHLPAPPVQMPSPQQLGVNPQQLNQSLQGLNLGGLPQYGGHRFSKPFMPAAPSPRLQNFQGLLSKIYGG